MCGTKEEQKMKNDGKIRDSAAISPSPHLVAEFNQLAKIRWAKPIAPLSQLDSAAIFAVTGFLVRFYLFHFVEPIY